MSAPNLLQRCTELLQTDRGRSSRMGLEGKRNVRACAKRTGQGAGQGPPVRSAAHLNGLKTNLH